MAGAAVGFFIAGPPGGLVGGGVTALTRFALRRSTGGVLRAQRRRQEDVLQVAARAAEMPVMDLLAALRSRTGAEDLLSLTLRAAADNSTTNTLFALAAVLAHTAKEPDGPAVAFETLFVRAVADCDAAHVRVLRAFTSTSNQLGLGDGSRAFDREMGALNDVQVDLVFPGLASVRTPVLAVLQRHGLIEYRAFDAGGVSGGGGPTTWIITDFGRTFIERLRFLDRVTQPWSAGVTDVRDDI
jgi:hypothetical protein